VQKFQFVFAELMEKTMDFIVTPPDRKKGGYYPIKLYPLEGVF